jgi:hypothetical protein
VFTDSDHECKLIRSWPSTEHSNEINISPLDSAGYGGLTPCEDLLSKGMIRAYIENWWLAIALTWPSSCRCSVKTNAERESPCSYFLY